MKTPAQQRQDIEQLAKRLYGDELGQAIITRKSVRIFAMGADRPLLQVEDDDFAYAAARTALRVLIRLRDRRDAAKAAELLAKKLEAQRSACTHDWQETSRDAGESIVVNERCTRCGAERSLEANNPDDLAQIREELAP